MTSDSCCIFGDQLFSRPLFVSTFALVTPTQSLGWGRGESVCVCVCVRGVWQGGMSLDRNRTWRSHKKQRRSRSTSDFFPPHPPLRCAAAYRFFFLRVMEQRTFREQLFFLVLCLSVLKGDSRYIEVSKITYIQTSLLLLLLFVLLFCTYLKYLFELFTHDFFFVCVPQNNEISKDELYSFFNSELKRETPEELMYRRPLRKSEEFCIYVPKDLHLKDLYQRQSNKKNTLFILHAGGRNESLIAKKYYKNTKILGNTTIGATRNLLNVWEKCCATEDFHLFMATGRYDFLQMWSIALTVEIQPFWVGFLQILDLFHRHHLKTEMKSDA